MLLDFGLDNLVITLIVLVVIVPTIILANISLSITAFNPLVKELLDYITVFLYGLLGVILVFTLIIVAMFIYYERQLDKS